MKEQNVVATFVESFKNSCLSSCLESSVKLLEHFKIENVYFNKRQLTKGKRKQSEPIIIRHCPVPDYPD